MKHTVSLKKTMAFLAIAAASLSPFVLKAQPHPGLYMDAKAGYNILNREIITNIGTPFGNQPGGYVKSVGGSAYLADVGWSFATGLRLEAEGAYSRNSITKATAGSLKDVSAAGSEDKSVVFFNVLYEFDDLWMGLSPYLGVGGGYAWIDWKNVVAYNSSETVFFNQTQGNPGYQGIVGISFLDHLVRGFSLTAEYRFMNFDHARTYNGQVLRSRFGAFPTSATVKNSRNQAILVGIRYQF